MDTGALVVVQRSGAVAEVMLNRPHRRNAVVRDMLDSLHSAYETLVADDEIRVLVLHGAPPAFCSGLDLDVMRGRGEQQWRAGFADRWEAFNASVYGSNKPMIAAIEGSAIGMGATLAFACDFIVAARSCRLELPQIRLGVGAAMSVAWLTARFGAARALELALYAKPLNGQELADRGIALEVARDGKALEQARLVARRLAENDPRATALIKSAVRAATKIDDFGVFAREVESASRASL